MSSLTITKTTLQPKLWRRYFMSSLTITKGYDTPSMEHPLTVIIIITTKFHLQYKNKIFAFSGCGI